MHSFSKGVFHNYVIKNRWVGGLTDLEVAQLLLSLLDVFSIYLMIDLLFYLLRRWLVGLEGLLNYVIMKFPLSRNLQKRKKIMTILRTAWVSLVGNYLEKRSVPFNYFILRSMRVNIFLVFLCVI